MQKTFVSILLLGSAVAACAQGTVQFSDSAIGGVSMRGGPSPGPVPPTPGLISFGLFYGIGESTSLTLLTSQFGVNSTVTAGVIANPLDGHSALTLVPIPGTDGGEADVYLQMAGWSASYGTDWAAAQVGAAVGNGYFGETPVILGPALGPTAGPGAVIWQLASGTNPNEFHPFILYSGPEPSTMALFGLGVAALLIFRRRK